MGRSRRSRRLESRSEGDILGHAGWVYSDLLLGVAVVFLAAVSFPAILPILPEAEDEVEPVDEAVEEEVEPPTCLAGISLVHIEVLLEHTLRGSELAGVASREMDRLLRERFNQPLDETTFGLMLAFGGHPDSGVGSSRAAGITDDIVQVLPDAFPQVVTRAYWGGSSSELANRVRLDLFPYITEPCDDE